jgi:opine dehydrogenase
MGSRVAIIGAGNGGKTTAVDLALQGWRVCLAELPEFAQNIEGLRRDPVLHVAGALTW